MPIVMLYVSVVSEYSFSRVYSSFQDVIEALRIMAVVAVYSPKIRYTMFRRTAISVYLELLRYE